MFEPTGPSRPLPAERIRLATERLTLWGPGWNLHFVAADDAALAEIARLALNSIDADELVELRTESPAAGLGQILDSLELDADRRSELASLLVDSSQCFYLWISCQDSSGSVRSKLILQDTFDEDTRRIYVWDW